MAELDIFIKQMQLLNQQGMYDSAEILGSFANSFLKHPTVQGPTYESLALLADTLYEKQEYRRALQYYRKAIQIYRPKRTAPKGTTSSDDELSTFKYKAASCYFKVGDLKNAIAQLESIVPRYRTPQVTLLLAKSHHQTGNDKGAIQAYKEVLQQNPYALEAIIALLELHVPPTDILPLYSGLAAPHNWIEKFIMAHYHQNKYDYQVAIDIFSQLDRSFPNGNTYVIQNIAKCEIQVSKPDKAKVAFERLRQADPHFVGSMDAYASLLKTQGQIAELSHLCTEIVRANPLRPEPWTSLAMYSEMKGKKDKAISFIDKALEIDEKHVIAHLLKGNIHLTLQDYNMSVYSFKRACSISKDLYSFTGLVRSYLSLGKLKEALAVAKEAHKLMPSTAQSHTLMGVVLGQATNANIRKKARQYYEAALEIDKNQLEAILGLVQLNITEQKYNEALKLLVDASQHHSKDFIYIKMAEVHVLMGKHQEAIQYFNTALSINPNSELAKNGLERLQKLLHGEDPDGEEQEQEDEEIAEQGEEEAV